MSKNISYDGIFKELLFEFPSENIVGLINNLFDKDYALNCDVQKLETESHSDGKKQSDMMFRIDDTLYHAEVQAKDDKSMPLRVFIYAYRAALQHGQTLSDDCLELDFPKSVVIYLRSTDKTPKEIKIKLNLPDGKSVMFATPTKHLKDYSLQDLTQDSSLIFAPYYPMLFEGETLKSPQSREKLRDEVIALIDKFKAKAENGEIGSNVSDLIIKSIDEILENVMEKSNISQKEVDEVMEAVRQRYNLEPLNWREEGRVEGKEEDATRMFERGFSFEDVQYVTKLKTETLEKIRKSLSIP